MTMPSDRMRQMATRMGRRAAEAGRPVASCPYNANGTPAQQVLARRWVHAYNGVRDPGNVSADG